MVTLASIFIILKQVIILVKTVCFSKINLCFKCLKCDFFCVKKRLIQLSHQDDLAFSSAVPDDSLCKQKDAH